MIPFSMSMSITEVISFLWRFIIRGFRQFLNMNTSRFGQRLEIETAFEKRKQTALAPHFRSGYGSCREPPVPLLGHLHATERVLVMRIESGRPPNCRRAIS